MPTPGTDVIIEIVDAVPADRSAIQPGTIDREGDLIVPPWEGWNGNLGMLNPDWPKPKPRKGSEPQPPPPGLVALQNHGFTVGVVEFNPLSKMVPGKGHFMRLNYDAGHLVSEKSRKDFEKQLQADIATALRIDAPRVSIVDLSPEEDKQSRQESGT